MALEEIPRKCDILRMVPAELAILKAMEEVEKLDADLLLTDAVVHLSMAKGRVSEYIDKHPSETLKWIPEAPKYPGVYAFVGEGKKNCTMDPNEALSFDSQKECQNWCNANPIPHFKPIAHSFTNNKE